VGLLIDDVQCFGEVWFHVGASNDCLTCVSLWERLDDHMYKVIERLTLLPSSHINHVCVYKRRGDHVIIVPE
jgi:hypothetical protein